MEAVAVSKPSNHSNPSRPEQRRHPRVLLPVGYAPVRIAAGAGERASELNEGHAYDLSISGVRFEIDDSLQAGLPVRLELDLPGFAGRGRTVHAHGTIVRYHEPDEVGPVRMALRFDAFQSPADRTAVEQYIGSAIAGAN